MPDALIEVSLCWSLQPRQVDELTLRVPEGSTLEAVVDAGIALCLQAATPQTRAALTAQLGRLKFMEPGIWGRKTRWATPVRPGDRIELYRPLKVDPKVARRQRFKRQGKGRTGLFANRKRGSAAGY